MTPTTKAISGGSKSGREMNNFSIGDQPCGAFVEKDELFGHNVHECFGPYGEERSGEPRCVAAVSSCETCGYDHHAGGWGTCPAPVE